MEKFVSCSKFVEKFSRYFKSNDEVGKLGIRGNIQMKQTHDFYRSTVLPNVLTLYRKNNSRKKSFNRGKLDLGDDGDSHSRLPGKRHDGISRRCICAATEFAVK